MRGVIGQVPVDRDMERQVHAGDAGGSLLQDAVTAGIGLDAGPACPMVLSHASALALADSAFSPYIGQAKLRCASGAIIPGALSIL